MAKTTAAADNCSMNQQTESEISPDQTEKNDPSKSRSVRKILRWILVGPKIVLGLVGIYFTSVLVGLIPVNRDFVETTNGIEIFVRSNAVHSDIILPISSPEIDWRKEIGKESFEVNSQFPTHMAFGWGDRGFYIETPTWNDLKTSTACNALFVPSQTVVHVSYSYRPMKDRSTRSLRISREQYRRLVNFIRNSFELDENGSRQLIQNAAYGSYDAFFVGRGTYHCFNTCNCWTGSGLKEAGVKTGWFTPMPKTVFWYFP